MSDRAVPAVVGLALAAGSVHGSSAVWHARAIQHTPIGSRVPGIAGVARTGSHTCESVGPGNRRTVKLAGTTISGDPACVPEVTIIAETIVGIDVAAVGIGHARAVLVANASR